MSLHDGKENPLCAEIDERLAEAESLVRRLREKLNVEGNRYLHLTAFNKVCRPRRPDCNRCAFDKRNKKVLAEADAFLARIPSGANKEDA